MSKSPRAFRTFGYRRKHRSCPLCQARVMVVVRKMSDNEREQPGDTNQ